MSAVPEMAEQDLGAMIASAAAGDEYAFARIVAAYHEDMRRVCSFVTRDDALAEDAVQSAWSIIWRKLGSLKQPARLRPWLVSVAVNQAKDQLRRRKRGAEIELSPALATWPPGSTPRPAWTHLTCSLPWTASIPMTGH